MNHFLLEALLQAFIAPASECSPDKAQTQRFVRVSNRFQIDCITFAHVSNLHPVTCEQPKLTRNMASCKILNLLKTLGYSEEEVTPEQVSRVNFAFDGIMPQSQKVKQACKFRMKPLPGTHCERLFPCAQACNSHPGLRTLITPSSSWLFHAEPAAPLLGTAYFWLQSLSTPSLIQPYEASKGQS